MTEDVTGGSTPPPLPVDDAPTAPPPAAAGTHAVSHSTEQTRTYPCQTCGSQLEFHIGQQQLVCRSCGNRQALLEAEGTVQENDLRAVLVDMRGRAEAHSQTMVSGEKEIVCQSCGGHTTFSGTWTAQRCPFCAIPIQRDDVHAAPDRLPVDGIMPFQVDQKTAEAALAKWVSSRWFAPGEFKDYSRAGSFSSVYTAYFTYDAEADTRYQGQRGDDYTVTVGSGDNKRTETRTRWRSASGQVHDSFDDVTVLANEGLHRGHTAALEPWPLQLVQPFSPEYVAGHLSRTYDNGVEECFTEAQEFMDDVIEGTIRSDIGGDHQRISSKQTTWSAMTFKHLLLPIWLLTVIYGDRTFQVMINGSTGEVRGERPYSKVKIAFAVLAAIILIAIIAVLYSSSR